MAEKIEHYRKTFNYCKKRWIERLGLSGYEIITEWFDRFDPPEHNTPADITVQWPYKKAYIRCNRSVITGMSDYDIERTVVHELCHILIEPARDGVQDHIEYATTGVERACFFIAAAIEKQERRKKVK